MRLLWASSSCLLDYVSGAALTRRTQLVELGKRGWAVRALSATNYDVKIERYWAAFREIGIGQLFRYRDEYLEHYLLRTQSFLAQDLTVTEASWLYARYLEQLGEYKPDYVYYYGADIYHLCIGREAQLRGIKTVISITNPYYLGGYHFWLRDIDILLTNTVATADLYRQECGIELEPVGTFVESRDYEWVYQQRCESGGGNRLVFVQATAEKGAFIVAVLMYSLWRRGRRIELDVIEGRGNWSEIVQRVEATLGTWDRSGIRVIKESIDMREYYRSARVLVAPSLWFETGLRVGVEAMICGVPVLTTRRGGIAEVMGDAGIFIELPESCYVAPYCEVPHPESSTMREIVNQIERLYEDEAYYQERCQRGRAVWRERHDLERNTERLMNALKRSPGGRSGTGADPL